jgi:hypothetical protein
VARHIFQACPVWIYTQSNITSIILIISVNIGYFRTKKETPRIKQVNSLFFIHPNIWKFEKVEILQISRVHDLYKWWNAIGYVNCDVILCVCPLIDHGSQPMKALEFLTYLATIFCRLLCEANKEGFT